VPLFLSYCETLQLKVLPRLMDPLFDLLRNLLAIDYGVKKPCVNIASKIVLQII